MAKRNTQFPPEPAALEDSPQTDGEDAPLESPVAPPADDTEEAAPSPPPEAESLDPSASPSPPPAPLSVGEPADAPPSLAPPAWSDLPVASVLPPVAPLLHTPGVPSPLEDRIQRMEAELAQLRNAQDGPRHGAVQQHANAATTVAPTSDPAVGFWTGLGRRLLSPSAPAAPRLGALASMVPPGVRHTWIVLDALTELRAMYWMFFDPRYRLSWTARLAPLVILALILTSYFWMPGSMLPWVGPIIDKVADLVLAYVLFKLLSYEARRYRETAPDLPPSLRQ